MLAIVYGIFCIYKEMWVNETQKKKLMKKKMQKSNISHVMRPENHFTINNLKNL